MTSVADLPLLELSSDSGETFPVDDPATGDRVHEVPRLGAAETNRALRAAEEALPAWRGLLAKERAGIMRRWSELMLGDAEALARLLTIERGKPLAESRVEIEYAASFLEYLCMGGVDA
ncbi:MAG: aldehyde dehydrogenase family protein [Actinomycetota bacterium]|nr:aldehyde dehydrogenase family protein [Actinomycetota bacterium]